jgi:hypothetical protein
MDNLNGAIWALLALVTMTWAYRELVRRGNSPSQPSRDVWDMQRRMMVASEQQLPISPEINKDLLLYYALTLEEMSETADALHCALRRQPNNRWSHVNVITQLGTCTQTLHALSSNLRRMIPAMSDLKVPLSLTDASAIFDGMMDCTVTIAGMPLAGGFPAAAGYAEVQSSNESKTNPITGKIAKDSSGKWIKDPGYKPPDLAGLLESARRPDYTARPGEE